MDEEGRTTIIVAEADFEMRLADHGIDRQPR